jgi:UDP-N-acetylglucosamine diphosphorylase/glucosamine-1-phosphate N-acetyltransferase
MVNLTPDDSAPKALILAAGKGVRMGGDLPKVLFPVQGKPMLWWVVRACQAAGVSQCVIVVGYKADLVREAMADQPNCLFVEQTQQLGTAHAARMAQPAFANQPTCDVFVLAGDGPLIRPRTLQRLLELHRHNHAAATLATAVLDDPTGYGRVLRHPDGSFAAIVEHKDATPPQLAIKEVNPSYYCFRSDAFFAALQNVDNHNRQSEYYLTDVPAILQKKGHRVCLVDAVPPEDVLSINTPEQLEVVDRILAARTARENEGMGSRL